MSTRRLIVSISAALILFASVPALLADEPVRRTIVVRDGKVIRDGKTIDLADFMGQRAHIGVSLTDMTPELREYFGAPKSAGVLVASVESGSPAEKAGLRPGDVIVGIDGKDVDSSGDIRESLRSRKQGDSVRIEFIRAKSRQTAVASVIERQRQPLVTADMEEVTRRLNEKFSSPEWKARLATMPNCSDLETKLRELETRMKELEKKLQK